MTTQPWDGVITADDEARYEAAGFGRPAGRGTRPALLIIDVQYRTVGDEPKPFFAEPRRWYDAHRSIRTVLKKH